jgi:hypothetical protein
MSTSKTGSSKSSTERISSFAESTTQKEERVMETQEHVDREVSSALQNQRYVEKDGTRAYNDRLNPEQTPPVSSFSVALMYGGLKMSR